MSKELDRRNGLAAVLGAGSLVFACVSAYYFSRAYTPPAELYDNERAILAFLYGAIASAFLIPSVMLTLRRSGPLAGVALALSSFAAGYLVLALAPAVL